MEPPTMVDARRKSSKCSGDWDDITTLFGASGRGGNPLRKVYSTPVARNGTKRRTATTRLGPRHRRRFGGAGAASRSTNADRARSLIEPNEGSCYGQTQKITERPGLSGAY